ncbi:MULTISPECIES: AraC family transcriptional regulator ligand-binding domain-containing protein [unclassified Sulfurospirillum]|uniref:AraC family transcriptional regulator ligand-binding domain-containing protein n=1 Tax=unclassified Sulfurospirillum TaxID=2618290 RepID=UPI0005035BE0|nr:MULTISPECIES: AraC family transcriptional regulator ligand-binding domain-containing protein [unclassified Sulfurospirillum]KFL33616.1 hypothetical protein JU57_09630 [Sulfurospirillum sp. SCADC]
MEHVSAVTLHFILSVLRSQYQINTDVLLDEIGINAEIFLEENSYIESDKVKALFYKAAEICKDPCLALHLGATSSSESLGLLGYMLANSANVEEMLKKLCTFSILIGKNLQFSLMLENGYTKLRFSVGDNPLIPVPTHQVEIHLSAIMTLIRQLSMTLFQNLPIFNTQKSLLSKSTRGCLEKIYILMRTIMPCFSQKQSSCYLLKMLTLDCSNTLNPKQKRSLTIFMIRAGIVK